MLFLSYFVVYWMTKNKYEKSEKNFQFRLPRMHRISDQAGEKEGDSGPRYCISGERQQSSVRLDKSSKPTSFIGEKRLLLQRLKN